MKVNTSSRIFVSLILLVFLFPVCIAGGEKEPAEEEINYIELAALMVRDGFYEKAEDALNEVDLKQEDLDLGRYYILRGLVHLHKSENEKSVESFHSAIQNGQTQPIIYIYIAQAEYRQNHFRKTLQALWKSGDQLKSNAGLYRMMIQCHWRLNQKTSAIGVIEEAEKLFPKMRDFTKQKILFLVNMGLYREAAQISKKFLERTDNKPLDYLMIGEALRRSKQYTYALNILEMSRLKYPDNDKIIYSLAHTYMDTGKFKAAAALFEEASARNPTFLPQAVELYRKAGKYHRAMMLNAEIKDQKVKTKQRLGILLEQQRYDGVVSLIHRLERLGLMKDQRVCYALAFSHFKIGKFNQAVKLLSRISDKDMFDNVTRLRKAIEVYRDSEWQIP